MFSDASIDAYWSHSMGLAGLAIQNEMPLRARMTWSTYYRLEILMLSEVATITIALLLRATYLLLFSWILSVGDWKNRLMNWFAVLEPDGVRLRRPNPVNVVVNACLLVYGVSTSVFASSNWCIRFQSYCSINIWFCICCRIIWL